ncbi:MAG: ThiF family adenylyltransferase [Aerococcus sp.]|nr:ThiF family adenylyltransferase [Aerococcus sp.]
MCENKIQLKSELSWKKCKDYISVYSDNRLLQKNIIQNDSLSVDDIFNFLLFLKEPRSKRELAEYKDINKKDKESIITLLEKEQYVKKAGDDSRLNRFVSSFPYTDYELFKSELLNSNILIIGLGTGGSYLTEYLIKLGINAIVLIDGDRVEQGNIESQIYTKDEVGEFKAKSLSERYAKTPCDITAINMYVDSYRSLINVVNLSNIDYIVNCADDQNLNIDIINHLFTDYTNIVLIAGGYSTLQQTVFKVTSKNYKMILDNLSENKETPDMINVNSGSILNSLFHTFSVIKMIFDDIFDIEDTEYAASDYYLNTYYIGNIFNAHIFNEFKNDIKHNYKYINCADRDFKYKQIESRNIDKHLLIPHLKIDALSQNYIKKDINWSLFDQYYSKKRHFRFKNKEVDDSSILKLFGDYADQYLYTLTTKDINKIIKEGRIYISSGRLHKQRAYTKRLGQDRLIYIAGDYPQDKLTHLLIHELLHYFCYTMSSNDYVHESFVRYHHLNFLIKNKDNDKISPLIDYMLFETYSSFVLYHVALGYEISVLGGHQSKFLDRIKSYTKNDNEIKEIIADHICHDRPLKTLKYYHAIAETAPLFAILEEGQGATHA